MSVDGIFSTPLFGASKETQKSQAATGFTQVFASMLAQQMREAMAGEDKGPLGTGGGATGDIYGTFLDQAMGRALADSPAMKPLNQAIERELSGMRAPVAKSAAAASAALTQIGADAALPSDSRGPLLLPPEPSSVASVLPPPPSLES
jgi:Rod binding domain-containing protein